MSWISKLMGKEDDSEGAPGAATPDGAEAAVLPEPAEGAPESHEADDPQPTASPAGTDTDQVLAVLRTHLVSTTEKHGQPLAPEELRNDIDLYEAGYLDSLMASEFLVLAEKEFGVPLPDWLIGGQANTLDRLAEYISGELVAK